jgi:hypothetical protein
MTVHLRAVRRLVRLGVAPARAVLAVVAAYKLSMRHMERLWDAARGA